jgi:plasmid maintenance system killer protein
MKIKFKEDALSELYETGKTKDRKYKQLCKSKKLVDGYIRAVTIMYDVDSTEDLKPLSYLHYEKLKYQHGETKSSVRLVNGLVERLLFSETDDGIEVELIEIDSTHYGNKD